MEAKELQENDRRDEDLWMQKKYIGCADIFTYLNMKTYHIKSY